MQPRASSLTGCSLEMDSKSRRFPFAVSSSSSLSSPSSLSSSSSALSASRLYGRGNVLGRDRFSREASVKLDSDYQSSRLLSSPRGYNSTESRHSNWKFSTPVSLSSSSSCDRTWTESASGDRGRLTDSERRQGTYCGLLGTSQDSESKRAKLSYTNRAAYSRSPSTSKPASSYSTLGNYSWKSSISPLSRSSSSSSSSSSTTPSEGLWARRDLEKRGDSGLTSLGESSYRPSGLTSSLYRSERVTSTYAQGARPKESQYSSHRENGSSSRRISAEYLPSPLERSSHRLTSDYQSGPFSRDTPRSSSSSTRTSASVSDPSQLSSWSSTPYAPLTGCSSSPPSSSPAPTPIPAQNGGDSDGRRTTRRLLSRLFSRRSSQESNSTVSSASDSRSFDSSPDEAPPSEVPPLVSRENLEAELRNSDPVQAFSFLRRRGPSLAPVRERADVVEHEQESLRSPAGLSWLNWNRCTPLFSRRRREGRDESARMDPHRSPQFPLGDRDGRKTPDRGTDCEDDDHDDDDDDEDESSEGATAAPSAGASGLSASLLQDGARLAGRSHGMGRVMTSPLFRMPENMIIGVGVGAEGRSQTDEQAKDKPAPSRDPERLRKIQESLLLEDSDEEEGDLCRICQMGEQLSSNPLIEPCKCTGSLQYVHQDCIKKWLRSKISSGSNLEAITTCELCKEKLHLNIENFDINELYRSHERSEYEFISCGLYLVVLLHLCEQRFSDVLGAVNDAGFFNLARTLHEHMDNLESSYAESDEDEAEDSRPSIDFCDLEDEDDDEEEEV
ncbi:E3 ubiquitin-protein ligase MARCH7 isoform X1 [Onychostoma macrolepis]|uniref:E3 ubiquitin-protein ligase MARCH7 isoform X1 n=1 Tax=Onychostoma macrolepis TaxID=369639 RepID=UPI00272C848C|nr:E3 ubiquitin-protein ligase MARCH7 isoform X1 [Onychostoma macrolepis]